MRPLDLDTNKKIYKNIRDKYANGLKKISLIEEITKNNPWAKNDEALMIKDVTLKSVYELFFVIAFHNALTVLLSSYGTAAGAFGYVIVIVGNPKISSLLICFKSSALSVLYLISSNTLPSGSSVPLGYVVFNSSHTGANFLQWPHPFILYNLTIVFELLLLLLLLDGSETENASYVTIPNLIIKKAKPNAINANNTRVNTDNFVNIFVGILDKDLLVVILSIICK